MKKYLLALALTLAASAAMALQEIPIPSVARSGTTTYSADMYARKSDLGITLNSVTTSITTGATITLTLQSKVPQGGYYDVLSSAPTALSTSTFTVINVGPGLPATTNVSANQYIPQVFRVKSVLAGTATYSIGAERH